MRTYLKTSFVLLLGVLAVSLSAHCQTVHDFATDSSWYQSDTSYDSQKIDVFYLVSTNVLSATDSKGETVWHSQLIPEDRQALQQEIAYVEKRMFYDHFNVVSPYYRQFTFDAIWQLERKDFATVYEKVVAEACESFDYYMEHVNKGRPFILAGFSQGAMLTLDILKHMTDSQYERMIACYTMGYRLSADDLKHPHIKAAVGETDKGVVVSFNSTQTLEGIWPFVAESATACINPVNWRTDDTPATFTYQGVKNCVQVDQKAQVLLVHTDKPSVYDEYYDRAPFYQQAGVSRSNLHHWDLLFYSSMIHDNALKRAGK